MMRFNWVRFCFSLFLLGIMDALLGGAFHLRSSMWQWWAVMVPYGIMLPIAYDWIFHGGDV